MRNYSIKDLRWSDRGHELDDFAARIADSDNQFYIYGNGREIEEFYERVGKYFADNIGGCVCMRGEVKEELRICDEAEIPDMENTRIICTCKDRKNIWNCGRSGVKRDTGRMRSSFRAKFLKWYTKYMSKTK